MFFVALDDVFLFVQFIFNLFYIFYFVCFFFKFVFGILFWIVVSAESVRIVDDPDVLCAFHMCLIFPCSLTFALLIYIFIHFFFLVWFCIFFKWFIFFFFCIFNFFFVCVLGGIRATLVLTRSDWFVFWFVFEWHHYCVWLIF